MMKIKPLLSYALSALFFITSLSYAEYTSSVSRDPGYPNYSSSVSNQETYHSYREPQYRAPVSSYVSFSYNNPGYTNYHRHRRLGPEWINVSRGYPLPAEAIVGGGERGYLLYVCRANFSGGTHPGKLLPNGMCDISYGGREISMRNYQVLTSHRPLRWVAASFGYIPPRAIVGGEENGNILYICKARYAGGEHPGKIIRQKCNIPYGGREISIPYYKVLTMG